MVGDADVAAAAGLIGEPARATLLLALMEEEALSARELANRAGIAPSTASEHLAKLLEGGLVRDHRQGRHRYFRLAEPAVATAIEALSAIAPARPVRSCAKRASARRSAMPAPATTTWPDAWVSSWRRHSSGRKFSSSATRSTHSAQRRKPGSATLASRSTTCRGAAGRWSDRAWTGASGAATWPVRSAPHWRAGSSNWVG